MSLKICFFAILFLSVSAVIKQFRPDMLPFLRIGGIVAVCTVGMTVISPLTVYVGSLFGDSELWQWGGIMLKALGIALLGQICADICRDCGENSAASGVEFIARLEILLLCLPMLESVISTAREVLSW